MTSQSNKTLCSAFWKHTNVRPGDRIYPCCRFKFPVGKFDGDLNTVLESAEYNKLRELSTNGEKIQGCEKCYYEESIGHKSLRQEFNEQYDADTVELKYLEIGIDNLCNMACDGCNSEFSTRWIAKEKSIYGKAQYGHINISDVVSVPNSVEKILFLGGEPLLTDRHIDILKLHKDAKNCTVIYNTNASIIPNKLCLDAWKEFKEIKFIVSIDGYEEVNEQVRHGSIWKDTLKFLDWCKSNNYQLSINSVIHRNNMFSILELPDFVKKYTDQWYVNVLTYPVHLDINTHEKDVLESFRKKLSETEIPNKNFVLAHLDN